jgi:PST family polysaccharide transporter
MLLAADPLVRVAFGEQWLAAIPVLRVIALFVLVMSIGFNAGDIYKAIGRTDILIKMGLLRVTLMIPVLWAGTYFGLVGVAVGHLIIGIGYNSLNLWVATRVVKVSWSDILRQLKPSFLSGLALILLAGPMVYLTHEILPPVRLFMIMLAGAIGYLSLLWLLERESLLRVGRLVGWPGWGRKRPASLALTSSDVDAG